MWYGDNEHFDDGQIFLLLEGKTLEELTQVENKSCHFAG